MSRTSAPLSEAAPTSLPETLRTFSDEQLADLFRARPDVLQPVPAGFDQLASRLCARTSVARALDELDRRTIGVLEATYLATEPTAAAVHALLGASAAVDEGFVRLRRLALVWGPDDSLRVPGSLGELLGPHPAGLGPPVAHALEASGRSRVEQLARDLEIPVGTDGDLRAAVTAALSDAARVRTLLADAGEIAREAATRLATHVPTGTLPDADRAVSVATAKTPAEQLLARGLLLRLDQERVVLPREVGLVIRDGRLYAPGALDPPPLTGPRHDPALVDRTAAGATLEVVRLVERLLEGWSSAPPPVLRTGGVGVRDLRRTAKFLEVDDGVAALLIECAAGAGLVGAEDESWLPTAGFDAWSRADPAARWARLATAWLDSTRLPALVGTRDERNKVRCALGPGLDRPDARRTRRLILAAFAGADAGVAPDTATIVAYVHWSALRRTARLGTDAVEAILAEAGSLGLTGLGALSEPGRALRADADPDEVAAVLRPHLPEPIDHVLLQADLTAIAPGPLRVDLANELGLVADAESHGGATVFRFSDASIRRGFDRGWSAADVHDLLARASRTPVPQPLSYLVDDVARRHGHLRAGSASAYLRSDDEAALSTLLADRRAAELGLRRIAPTVLVSANSVDSLVDALRNLGYAPVAESPTGAIAISTPQARRAEQGMQRYRLREPVPLETDVLAAAVRAVRASDKARANRPVDAGGYLPRTASTRAVDILRDALGAGVTVWLGYVDQHGSLSDRLVDPVRIEGGRLTAFDHAAGESRSFALHRITGAMRIDVREDAR